VKLKLPVMTIVNDHDLVVRNHYSIIDQRVDTVVQPILFVHPVEDHVHVDAALFRPADGLDGPLPVIMGRARS
jgi:hypothetical protein